MSVLEERSCRLQEPSYRLEERQRSYCSMCRQRIPTDLGHDCSGPIHRRSGFYVVARECEWESVKVLANVDA
jgi:hypothetical protein